MYLNIVLKRSKKAFYILNCKQAFMKGKHTITEYS